MHALHAENRPRCNASHAGRVIHSGLSLSKPLIDDHAQYHRNSNGLGRSVCRIKMHGRRTCYRFRCAHLAVATTVLCSAGSTSFLQAQPMSKRSSTVRPSVSCDCMAASCLHHYSEYLTGSVPYSLPDPTRESSLDGLRHPLPKCAAKSIPGPSAVARLHVE